MTEAMHYSYFPMFTWYFYWEQKSTFLLKEDIQSDWVIFAPISGAFSYEIGAERGIGQFGDLIVCPPGIVFYREMMAPMTFHHVRFQWRNEVGAHAPIDMMPSGKLTIENTVLLAQLYERFLTVYSQKQWSRKQKGKLNHHLQDLWYLYFEETGEAGAAMPFSEDQLMLQVRDHLAEAALDSLCLKTVAEIYRISPSQLSKRFKKTLGLTPIEYVTSLRLEKAKKLLLETDQPLDWIAEQCGYPNGYYLNRVFSKHVRHTPGYFRKIYQT